LEWERPRWQRVLFGWPRVLSFDKRRLLAAHDLKGDALHTLRGAEGMLLAGAARYGNA
jgi:hypothetical protein